MIKVGGDGLGHHSGEVGDVLEVEERLPGCR